MSAAGVAAFVAALGIAMFACERVVHARRWPRVGGILPD